MCTYEETLRIPTTRMIQHADPFCTIEPNTGIVEVPDPRLDVLAKINESVKKVPTTLEFVDVAGLVKGASDGEGLGNQFLATIRQCDAIVHVVRSSQNISCTLLH